MGIPQPWGLAKSRAKRPSSKSRGAFVLRQNPGIPWVPWFLSWSFSCLEAVFHQGFHWKDVATKEWMFGCLSNLSSLSTTF